MGVVSNIAARRVCKALGTIGLLTCTAAAALAQPAADPAVRRRPGGPDTEIPFPHPVITEVLYKVPREPVGDANQDGRREAVGDEFVELYNPHDQPIELTGYTLRDSQGDDESAFSFTFPTFTLGPGEVVVVFNGYRSDTPGALDQWGTASKAPRQKHSMFNGAWVFTAQNTRRVRAFADTGDFVVLYDPTGAPIDAVVWGSPSVEPPRNTMRVSRYFAGQASSSAQRIGATGDMIPHFVINNLFFSPGKVCVTAQGCDPPTDR